MGIKKTRPVWAEINLDNLIHNIKEVRRVVRPETLVTAVIKADGYGHGACEIAKVLLENGADRLAVATLSEALELRSKYSETSIMVLGYTPETSAEEVIKYKITPTIYSLKQAESFSEKAKELGLTVACHIKIDTGMSRLGMQPTRATGEIIKKIAQLPNLIIEGLFTHFAVADETDKSFTHIQYDKFHSLCKMLVEIGVHIPIKHVSNSAAIIDLPQMNLDNARAGIMLYGLYPSDDVNKKNVTLKPVMSLKAEISQVKEVDKGIGISYGLKFKTDKPSKIATLPIGYADGFTRMLSGKAEVLVKGKRVPIVGRICMDQCMIDVTEIEDIKRGDEVILMGSNGIDTISADEIAKKLGTINYEVVCMIGRRVPRVYRMNNEIVKIKDYVLQNSVL